MATTEDARAPRARQVELLWVGLAGLWAVAMVVTLGVTASGAGSAPPPESAPPSTGAAVDHEVVVARAQALIDTYAAPSSVDHTVTVVKPPPGADIYLLGRLWEWWPQYELQVNETYRLHLASEDWVHGFALAREGITAEVLPGYETVLNITPTRKGTQIIKCSVYCGVGHDAMTSKLYVVEPGR